MQRPGKLDPLGDRELVVLGLSAARLRLFIAALGGLLAFLILPDRFEMTARALVGWDLGAVLFIVLVLAMIASSTQKVIRRRAALQDSGRMI